MMSKKFWIRYTAAFLAAVLFCGTVSGQALAAGPLGRGMASGSSAAALTAPASGTEELPADDTGFFAELWNQVQENGEDVVTFPGRIRDELQPDEGAYYGFYPFQPRRLPPLQATEKNFRLC